MKHSKLTTIALALCAATLLLAPVIAGAQAPDAQKHVAALKQSLAEGQKQIRQYEWVETTAVSLKGEEKSRQQKRCYYGADGKLQKVPMSEPPPPQEKKRGLKGRVIENKKEEMKDYMQDAVALIKSYVPPEPARIQAVKDAGGLAVEPAAGKVAVTLNGYAKPGDKLSIDLDPATDRLLGLAVNTYLDDAKDAVSLKVSFGALPDGTGYPANIQLDAPAKNLAVNVTNSGHRKMAQ